MFLRRSLHLLFSHSSIYTFHLLVGVFLYGGLTVGTGMMGVWSFYAGVGYKGVQSEHCKNDQDFGTQTCEPDASGLLVLF